MVAVCVQPVPSPRAENPPAAANAAASELFESRELVTIVSGCRFTEGPIYRSADHTLLFSDIPGDAIYACTIEKGVEKTPASGLTVVRKPAGNPNGLAFDHQGRLLVAHHNGTVTRAEPDGTITVLAKAFEGQRLNSPNDLVVTPAGDIIFSDPPFGVQAKDRRLDYCGIFRLTPDGTLSLLIKEITLPNGLALSNDATTLYLADMNNSSILAADLGADGSAANLRTLAKLDDPGKRGRPDGVKVDLAGNIWSTGPGGLWITRPDGTTLDRLDVQGASNLCFGGPDGRSVFITAGAKVFMARLTAPAISPPADAKPATDAPAGARP